MIQSPQKRIAQVRTQISEGSPLSSSSPVKTPLRRQTTKAHLSFATPDGPQSPPPESPPRRAGQVGVHDYEASPWSVSPVKMLERRKTIGEIPSAPRGLAVAGPHGRAARGFPVWLHVYDLGPVTKWMLNSWAAPERGAFHAAIEVLGVEWSFQALLDCGPDGLATGVSCHHPKSHPRHVYRESVWLGTSALSFAEIGQLLACLKKVWVARDYHFINHNCTDFAERLAGNLGTAEPFPRWVHGIAKGFLNRTAMSHIAQPHFLQSGSSWGGVNATEEIIVESEYAQFSHAI